MSLPRPNVPLLLTVTAWGFNFVAMKRLYGEGVQPDPQMSASSVALLRYVGMWVLLVLVCKARGESLRYPPGHTLRFLWMGFLSMGLYMVLFLEGMRTSTAAEGAIILGTAPVLTALIAVAAGQERFVSKTLIGTLIAFAGVCVVVLAGAKHGGESRLIGNLLILTSALVWAYGSVFSRNLVSRYSPYSVLALSMPGALPLLVPYGLADSLALDYAAFRADTWFMFGWVVVAAGVIGFIGFFEGVRQIGAPAAMLYQYFVPPIAALSAFLVMGSALLPLQLVGLAVVLMGVATAQRARTRAALALAKEQQGQA